MLSVSNIIITGITTDCLVLVTTKCALLEELNLAWCGVGEACLQKIFPGNTSRHGTVIFPGNIPKYGTVIFPGNIPKYGTVIFWEIRSVTRA